MLFDSSVLIAACVASHPKHEAALVWVQRALSDKVEYVVAAHSVIEVFSVLTRALFKPLITPLTATQLIEQNIKKKAKIIALTGEEHFQVIDRMNQLGLKGGVVYDALIVQCAQKSASTEIVTSNSKDFLRLLPDQSISLITV